MNLEEIRARTEAATPGPWEARNGFVVAGDLDGVPDCVVSTGEDGPQELADAEFVAHARTDVPALLDRLDRIRRLCQSYTPEPPPLFRNPTSQHGEGYNHGTRDMAEAVLGVLNGEEEST